MTQQEKDRVKAMIAKILGVNPNGALGSRLVSIALSRI